MSTRTRNVRGIRFVGRGADRVVPRTGHTAWLTSLTAAAMAFLAVFALAFLLATGRIANRWSSQLAHSATVRISAPAGELAAQTRAVLRVLATTPGVASARALSDAEEQALLRPWFGPDLPLGNLPIPRLVAVSETDRGFDTKGLRLRLAAEAPGAVLDDHSRWRKPLVAAARRLRWVGIASLALIALSTAMMITLAANAALAANAQVIRVLRLIGARDVYIARAFVRRFTLRAVLGAVVGAAAGIAVMALLPAAGPANGFLTGLGYHGLHWLLPPLIVPFTAIIAFWATRLAAFRALRETS